MTYDRLNGEICVTEGAHSSLHVFNEAGIETFRSNRFAGLILPQDGAVDAEGRLVVLTRPDGRRATIARLDIYGEPEDYAAEPPVDGWSPDHLLLTRDVHYLTIESDTGLIAKHHAATGALIWSHYLGDGEIVDKNLGRPVEDEAGMFFLPGGDLHQVLILDEMGRLLDQFGKFGTAPGRLVFPVGVALGPDGSLLVLDRMRHKVLSFDREHRFVSEFGSLGLSLGTFYHPVSLTSDEQGRVFVAQGYRGWVHVFDVRASGSVE